MRIEMLPSGGKTWRFKLHLNGKRKEVTMGAFPSFTLRQARDRHEEPRALVARGQSPAKAKQAAVSAQKIAEARRLTFRSFAQRWVDETFFYRSGGYVAQTVRWLEAHVSQWGIPAERKKMDKPNRVFLPPQAVDILRQKHGLTGHGHCVFPSIFRDSVPMSDLTLNHSFKRMDFGMSDFSPHGTRGTAATLFCEHGFARDVVELLMAHSEKNAPFAAW